MSGFNVSTPPTLAAASASDARIMTSQELEELERANIRRALACCDGKISGDNGAARLLGIPPTTLNSRIKALQIRRTEA
jgi:transcriptional regulator with GAF, ATPase, and Fis domain